MTINFKKMEVLFEEECAIKDHFQIIAPPAGEKSWFSFKDKKKIKSYLKQSAAFLYMEKW